MSPPSVTLPTFPPSNSMHWHPHLWTVRRQQRAGEGDGTGGGPGCAKEMLDLMHCLVHREHPTDCAATYLRFRTCLGGGGRNDDDPS